MDESREKHDPDRSPIVQSTDSFKTTVDRLYSAFRVQPTESSKLGCGTGYASFEVSVVVGAKVIPSNYVENFTIAYESVVITVCVNEAGTSIAARVDLAEEGKVTVESYFDATARESISSTGIGQAVGEDHTCGLIEVAKVALFEIQASQVVGTYNGVNAHDVTKHGVDGMGGILGTAVVEDFPVMSDETPEVSDCVCIDPRKEDQQTIAHKGQTIADISVGKFIHTDAIKGAVDTAVELGAKEGTAIATLVYIIRVAPLEEHDYDIILMGDIPSQVDSLDGSNKTPFEQYDRSIHCHLGSDYPEEAELRLSVVLHSFGGDCITSRNGDVYSCLITAGGNQIPEAVDGKSQTNGSVSTPPADHDCICECICKACATAAGEQIPLLTSKALN